MVGPPWWPLCWTHSQLAIPSHFVPTNCVILEARAVKILPFNLHFSFIASIDAVTYNIVFYFIVIFTSQVTALCQYRDCSVGMNAVWNIFLHGTLTWLLLWLSYVFVTQNKHTSSQYNAKRRGEGGWGLDVGWKCSRFKKRVTQYCSVIA